MRSDKVKAFVLDTSSIVAGILSSGPGGNLYVTPLVIAEVNKTLGYESLIDIRNLLVREPLLQNVEYILKRIKELGEAANISAADLSVLALAYELSQTEEVEILTDDYSIQNIATNLGIRCRGLGVKEIKSLIVWKYYCKGCGREYKAVPKDRICILCGSDIVRKPTKKAKKDMIL